jgi:hypothetical protein
VARSSQDEGFPLSGDSQNLQKIFTRKMNSSTRCDAGACMLCSAAPLVCQPYLQSMAVACDLSTSIKQTPHMTHWASSALYYLHGQGGGNLWLWGPLRLAPMGEECFPWDQESRQR